MKNKNPTTSGRVSKKVACLNNFSNPNIQIRSPGHLLATGFERSSFVSFSPSHKLHEEWNKDDPPGSAGF